MVLGLALAVPASAMAFTPPRYPPPSGPPLAKPEKIPACKNNFRRLTLCDLEHASIGLARTTVFRGRHPFLFGCGQLKPAGCFVGVGQTLTLGGDPTGVVLQRRRGQICASWPSFRPTGRNAIPFCLKKP